METSTFGTIPQTPRNPDTTWNSTDYGVPTGPKTRVWIFFIESKGQWFRGLKGFVDAYDIDMGDFEPSNVDDYKAFEDFFTRAHAPGSRPIHESDNPSKAVVVYETLSAAKTLWINRHSSHGHYCASCQNN